MKTLPLPLALAAILSSSVTPVAADQYTDPPAPTLHASSLSNGQKRITFTPYPSADTFRMLKQGGIAEPWTEDTGGTFSNLTWTGSAGGAHLFRRLEVTPLDSNRLLTATALNKLAYGPTPELLDRLSQGTGNNSAAAWIAEQLSPESITERAAQAHTGITAIEARFGTPTNYIVSGAQQASGPGTAALPDLQAWLSLNAVFADRQLLEVLTQFWENHFVTFAGKSANQFVGLQFRDAYPQRAAGEFEWREVTRWRQVMMQPSGTFHDFLRISAESCAMILYLDTATSRGNPPNIPNENYSRELLELFTMGVDNGYDQSDITNMAPCWTGWTIELVTAANASNPFAAQSTIQIAPGSLNATAITNLLGVWAMNFKPNRHATYAKTIFGGKSVPSRFGPPYTTKTYGGNAAPGLYQLNIPARTGTNGFRDGYDVIQHLADLPFTQEYISVKLCRLLIHDGFHTGYDFTDVNLSEEGQLVKACMAAWENSTPRGQLRRVLETIVNSALFRGQGAQAHKVKTPLEFAVSSIRALRQSNNGSGLQGTWTAYTDGYGLVNSQGGGQRGGTGSALMRMGSMSLFNREEPDGYPEAGSGWADAGSLVERMRFVSSLLKPVADTNKNDANLFLRNNVTEPVQLLQLRLPNSADQRHAGKVAGLFLGLLYPGEGRASLEAYQRLAVDFLNTADDGVSGPDFASLTPGSGAYDTRVRSMVAALLSLQRFNEQ